MKKTLILLLISFYLGANAQGIEFFKGTLEEAKALAKKENKAIFMDCYTTWCGPCKRMSKNVFPTKEAGDFFNEHFINFKQDMEKGEGRAIASKYGVRSYPTLIFLDYTGAVIFKTKGARRDAKSLIQVGKQALKPSPKTLKTLETKWAEGNRKPSFLKEYIKVKAILKKDYEEIFSEYLKNISEADTNSEENLSFIYKYTKNINSDGITFISNNKSVFLNHFSKKTIDKKINTIALESISLANSENSSEIMTSIKKILKKFKPTDYKKQTNFIETKLYGKTKDWGNYDKAVTKYLKKYMKNNPSAHRNVAWNYYMNIDDTKKLEKAEKWMQTAIKQENTYENNLTQSYLLYKLKKYSKAQDAIEYALILAKESKSKKRTKNAQILKDKIVTALKNEKKTVEIDSKEK